MNRTLLALALGCALSATLAGPAAAFRDFHRHGHPGPYYAQPDPGGSWWRHGHWHHGRHFGRTGWWWIAGGVLYVYPVPVYPYPPAVVVAPAPPVAIVPQAPAPAAPGLRARPYCREYQGDAIIDGTRQRFYGTACLQPDGAWHIVR